MFDDTENTGANEALRSGLYDLPTPEVSPDFDRRIQLALIQKASWRQTLWTALRPALPAMGWTMTAMLLLLHIAQQPAAETGTLPSLASAPATAQPLYSRRSEAQGKQSEDLESIDLTYASLSFLSRPMRRNIDKNG